MDSTYLLDVFKWEEDNEIKQLNQIYPPLQSAADEPENLARKFTYTDQTSVKNGEIPMYIKLLDQDQVEDLASDWTNDPTYMEFTTYFSPYQNLPSLGMSFRKPNLVPVLVSKDDGCLGDTYVLNDYGTLDFYLWNEVQAWRLDLIGKSPEIIETSSGSGNFQRNFEIQLGYIAEHAGHINCIMD